jgi:UDP-3-O-[3-hydroxymyristoyl] N-acetylglucosamine deacetylase/3-hydroxyacyl-[acyl-carrier-protein] dehydratase
MELIAPIRRGLCPMRGQVFVGTTLVMDAELMAQIVRNKIEEEQNN